MALNPTPVGDTIAAFVKANAPAAGTPVTDAQLRTIWEGIMNIIYTDLKSNLSVTPGTFQAGGNPVTGSSGPAQ